MMCARLKAALMSPAAATVWVQLLTVGAQLGVDVMVARMLGPALTGEVVFALATAGLLSVVMLFGTGEVAVELYARGEVRPQRVLTASAVVLSGGAVLGALGALGVVWWSGVGSWGAGAVALAMTALVINAASAALNQAIVGMDASKRELTVTLWSRGALVAATGAAAWMGSVHGVLGGYVLAAILQLLLRARLVNRELFELELELDAETLSMMWKRGRHIGLGSIFGTLSNRADTLALRALCGPTATGVYGAAYRIVAGVQVIASASSLALFPALAKGQARAKRMYAFGAFGGALGLVVGAAWMPEIIVAWVYGDEFAAAAAALEVLFVAAAAQWLNIWGSRWLVTKGLERTLPWAQAVGCATLVVGLWSWLPGGGAMGAAWATLAADVAVLMTMGLMTWSNREESGC